ncbi:hypothetical protein GCM10020256_55810 [Streptomyces thermocoprophilus]
MQGTAAVGGRPVGGVSAGGVAAPGVCPSARRSPGALSVGGDSVRGLAQVVGVVSRQPAGGAGR